MSFRRYASTNAPTLAALTISHAARMKASQSCMPKPRVKSTSMYADEGLYEEEQDYASDDEKDVGREPPEAWKDALATLKSQLEERPEGNADEAYYALMAIYRGLYIEEAQGYVGQPMEEDVQKFDRHYTLVATTATKQYLKMAIRALGLDESNPELRNALNEVNVTLLA